MGESMRILTVNVNTTEAMTHSIGEAARAVANPGTEIIELTPKFGADSCEGNFESYLAAIAVMDVVTTYEGEFDAVVQAGYGEHGKEGLMELLDVPVVDITDAGAQLAHLLGYKYSVVTTLDRAVPLVEERLVSAGLMEKCASVRATGLGVLELEDQDVARKAIKAEAEKAIKDDLAEVIVLGCGGMAGLDKQISEELGVPVVDGVSAAVKLAEVLVNLGLSTSKINTYAPPRPKVVKHWPLSNLIQQ